MYSLQQKKNSPKNKTEYNLQYDKRKVYYYTVKKLECKSLIHSIKVQVTKIPKMINLVKISGKHK